MLVFVYILIVFLVGGISWSYMKIHNTNPRMWKRKDKYIDRKITYVYVIRDNAALLAIITSILWIVMVPGIIFFLFGSKLTKKFFSKEEKA